MKTLLNRFTLPVGVLFLGFWSAGCYTQLGTVEEERNYAQDVEEAYVAEDTVSTEDYEQARDRFYNDSYDYYYPTVMVGVGYSNPWYWHNRSWYSYDPFWYDPFWGWCGTYYPRYYGGWYSGWYDGWYDGYYPRTYYGHGGSGYVSRDGGRYGATRTFGSTRTSGTLRGSSGSSYTPVSGRTNTGATPSSLPTGRVSTGTRAKETKRGGAAVGGGTTRSTGGREGSVRREAPRSAPRPESGTRTTRSGERYSPPPSGGGSSSGVGSSNHGGSRSSGSSSGQSGGSSSGGSRGSSAPSNTGDRGGNRR